MTTVVIMPGGFHPFHAGHLALYQSAQRAFPDADVYVAATDDVTSRPFPFQVKEKLAQLAGVNKGRFMRVKSPFKAEEITAPYNPAKDVLIFVRSEKDATKQPQAGGVKKDGSASYLQPLLGAKKLEPFAKHAYMAYLPTVEFGPGMTSATEIRSAWPQLNDKRKTALVMSLYPKTQTNPQLAATVVKLLDTAMGTELKEFAPGHGGGESGRWYTDDQMTDIVGDGWYNDLDVSGDIPKQQMIQQAQAWLDDQGYSVQVLNCKINDDDMEWYIEGSFYNPRFAKKGVAEGGAETSWSNDTDTITLQDILELTKHIKQTNLPINDNLKSKLLHWEGNPEEIERVNQVTVSNQFPILIMVDEQGQIAWILDGNHRLHKAIQSQAKTIPAKLIRPSNLDDKAKKIFNIKEQGVAEGSQEINWVKPNFDFEWHEVEEQSRMKQVPVDVRQYYQKHFPNKDAWLKAVQNGKAVVVPPDHAYEIRNAPFDKASLQKVLAPTGHEGPIGPAKEKRVNDLFDKGQVEMPIILKTSQGLWLIGGKTRLGTANYVKGLPAKVWLIGGEQGVAEGSDSNLSYQGNCTEDDVIEHIFGDVNNFANMVEEHGDEFTVGDLVVKYDPETDVHSFYYKKQGVAEVINPMTANTSGAGAGMTASYQARENQPIAEGCVVDYIEEVRS